MMTRKFLSNDMSSSPRKAGRERASHIKNMMSTQRGTMYFRQKGDLTHCLWRDSRIFSILSTRHQAYRKKPTDHVLRRFSLDGVERPAQHEVPAPRQLIEYQKHMSGVDRGDQVRSYHTVTRKSNIWWKQLVYFLIDLCRVNAWICFKVHHAIDDDGETPNPRHTKFIMDIAEGLIDGFTEADAQYGELRIRRQNLAALPVGTPVSHRLERLEGWGKKCAACDRAGRRRPVKPGQQQAKKITSRFGCMTCGVHLCKINPDPEHPCFQEWHPEGRIVLPE